jgi:hypothetical protein
VCVWCCSGSGVLVALSCAAGDALLAIQLPASLFSSPVFLPPDLLPAASSAYATTRTSLLPITFFHPPFAASSWCAAFEGEGKAGPPAQTNNHDPPPTYRGGEGGGEGGGGLREGGVRTALGWLIVGCRDNQTYCFHIS